MCASVVFAICLFVRPLSAAQLLVAPRLSTLLTPSVIWFAPILPLILSISIVNPRTLFFALPRPKLVTPQGELALRGTCPSRRETLTHALAAVGLDDQSDYL